MKKLIPSVLAVSALSLSLAACGDWSMFNPVGTGVSYVGTSATVLGTGVAVLVGQPATATDVVVYRQRGVVYHDGYSYRIINGRYVLVR